MKYEYRMVQMSSLNGYQDVLKQLNKLGQEGFRLTGRECLGQMILERVVTAVEQEAWEAA